MAEHDGDRPDKFTIYAYGPLGSSEEKSHTGHVWYSVTRDGKETHVHFGARDGLLRGATGLSRGVVHHRPDVVSRERHEIAITREQADKLLQYPCTLTKNGQDRGVTRENYHLLNNNCATFTFAAAEHASIEEVEHIKHYNPNTVVDRIGQQREKTERSNVAASRSPNAHVQSGMKPPAEGEWKPGESTERRAMAEQSVRKDDAKSKSK